MAVYYSRESYLEHHGIHGQKWGNRRFQYEDGSLTPEGRRRYLNSDGTLNRKGRKVIKNYEHKIESLEDRKLRIIKTGDVVEANKYKSDFSNDELRDVKTRYELQDEIKKYAARETPSVDKKIKDLTAKLDTFEKAATAAAKTYNITAKVINGFSNNTLPTIDLGGGNKNKNKNNKKR